MAEKLSFQEKVEMVLIYGENYHTTRETAIIFNGRHPHRHVNQCTVGRIIKRFKETGSVENKYKTHHRSNVTSEETSLNVLLSATENPKMSLAQREQEQGVCEKSIRRIFKKNNVRAYKPIFRHTLQERDLTSRLDFCFWFQGMVEDDPYFSRLFTDEASFSSNGTVNSQNCRWWSTQNPHFTIECKNQYSFKTNVWCGVIDNRILGPFFFRRNLNAENYLIFLQTVVSDFIDDLPLNMRQQFYFQHDGASIHSTVAVREWLNDNLPNRWIGRFSENPWPARSPDITPMDFFFWGFLKNEVYKHRPFRNLDHLEEVITICVRQIRPTYLRNAAREVSSRTIKCIENGGGHVE